MLGRALRIHALIDDGGAIALAVMDRLRSTPTRAATSSGVGVPRTTLTSGSSSIDRAYDERPKLR
jgi:hypothetical protein